tara:strand:- start:4298 stop:4618 length:321 start_codon:yes stop_codon:yes gene_type:complete
MHLSGLVLKRIYAVLVKSIARFTMTKKKKKIKAVKVPNWFGIDEWNDEVSDECEDLLEYSEELNSYDLELRKRELFFSIMQIRTTSETMSIKMKVQRLREYEKETE